MGKHRKNKRGFKVPKNKYEGQFYCLSLYGGYAYDEKKRRVIRYYGSRNHKWLRTHFNHQLRREIRQMIDKEEYNNVPNRKGDMWYWD